MSPQSSHCYCAVFLLALLVVALFVFFCGTVQKQLTIVMFTSGAKALEATQRVSRAEAETAAVRDKLSALETELASAWDAAKDSAALQEALQTSRAEAERLAAKCADADKLRAELSASKKLAADLQSKVDAAVSDAASARERNASLQTELTAARCEVDDSRRELVALQRQAESDASLAEQKRLHIDSLLQDARARVDKLEASLRKVLLTHV
jgi:predicted  nucleic acid-binding Zn-ribbon protein